LKHFAAIEDEYVTASEFYTLTDFEQVTLVSRFLRENVVEPLQYLWLAHKHITTHPEGQECAQSILCHLNSHMKKEGPIKQMVTKVFSLGSSYGWTVDVMKTTLDRWQLYQAIWQGCAPETDCSLQYTPTGKTCHVFPWQVNTMSLNFEHTEL
jgi:hypothetical protein